MLTPDFIEDITASRIVFATSEGFIAFISIFYMLLTYYFLIVYKG